MPSGGRRPGAGRKPGQKTRATIERDKLAQRGLEDALKASHTPLEIMLRKMNGDPSITDSMFAAATAAAPYIHPRLASTDTTIKSDNTHRVVADKPMSIDEWEAQFAPHANDAVAPEDADDDKGTSNAA